jgi:O-acetyl-ADP-ribose deacetylase (regulator of RNase III)
MGIESIAFPALGCGNGGLNWNDVKPVMIEFLEDLDIKIEIYEPVNQTETNLSENQTEEESKPKPSELTYYSN